MSLVPKKKNPFDFKFVSHKVSRSEVKLPSFKKEKV
jgi:hypothetical protein